jgi:hypothetical protein
LRQRLRARLAGALATLLVGAGLAILPATTASAATVPATAYPPVALAPETPLPGYLLTDTSGGVTAGCSSPIGTDGFVTRDADGEITQRRATPSSYTTGTHYEGCVRSTVVGADGTLFVLANGAPNGQVGMIKAIKNDVEQWSYTLPCGAHSIYGGMVVGVDGNVYVVFRNEKWPCDNNDWRLMGMSATAPVGTTVPTVLIDETYRVSGGFSLWGGISAYEDGIVIRTTEGVKYYEYDGTRVADYAIAGALNGTYKEYDDTDLDGRVVVAVKASSSIIQQCNNDNWVAGELKAYGPGGFQWTYSLGNCTKVYEVRPSPYGVIVHYQAPDDYVYGNTVRDYLQAFDANGVSQWRVQVSSVETSLVDRFMMFAVDLNGNVALMRQVSRTVLSQWGTEYHYPEVHLTLLSGANGHPLATRSFIGDQVGTNGNGYRFAGYGFTAITRDVWYVPLMNCWQWQSCTQSTAALYAVTMPGVEMDYPRGAVLGESGVKTVPMATIGDSFSSGIGALKEGEDYEHAICSRSPSAYGNLLSGDFNLNLRMPKMAFAACAGAKSAEIESLQINSIPANAKSVFLTAGGNDAEFVRLGGLCVFANCATVVYESEFDGYLTSLPQKLEDLYQAVLDRAPQATVYVLGYPHILPLEDCTDAGSGGWWTALQAMQVAFPVGFAEAAKQVGLSQSEATAAAAGSNISITNDEAIFVNTFENQLNLVVSDAVDEVDDERLVFVSTTQPGSPLAGHQLCSSEPYFNGVDPLKLGDTFHPNVAGQEAMYQVAREALEDHQPQYVLAG